MSLLYSNNFNYSAEELKKYPEFVDSNLHHQLNHQQSDHTHNQLQYRSAPNSLLATLADGNNGGSDGTSGGGGGSSGCENYQSSSSDIETMLARLISSGNESENSGGQNGYLNGFSPMYNQEVNAAQDHNSARVAAKNNLDGSYSVLNSLALENSTQPKKSTGSCSNLARQSSSPAGIFSALTSENGFAMMSNAGTFGSCNGMNDANSSSARMNSQLNFSRPSSGSRHMPQITEEGSESIGISSSEDHCSDDADGGNRSYCPNYSLDNSALRSLKRARNSNGNTICTSQNSDSASRVRSLTHHSSLPINFNDMYTGEVLLDFQDTAQFKVRAKRGCATHPRSIAERVRRTRINEKMKKLQELFPTMDKQTSTADMLDFAVDYINDLQKQLKTLTEARAKCTCSS